MKKKKYNYNDDFINTGVITFKRKLDEKACTKIIQAIRKNINLENICLKQKKNLIKTHQLLL